MCIYLFIFMVLVTIFNQFPGNACHCRSNHTFIYILCTYITIHIIYIIYYIILYNIILLYIILLYNINIIIHIYNINIIIHYNILFCLLFQCHLYWCKHTPKSLSPSARLKNSSPSVPTK